MSTVETEIDALDFAGLTEREKELVRIATKRAVQKAGRKLYQTLHQLVDFAFDFNGTIVEYEVKYGDYVTFSEDKLRQAGVVVLVEYETKNDDHVTYSESKLRAAKAITEKGGLVRRTY
jgi:uncharacterized protein with von Willebrand factor type A (vWA) domain